MQAEFERAAIMSQAPAPKPDPQAVIEAVHLILDIIGFIDPTPTADSINGVIYLIEGRHLEAGISFVAGWLPYIGDAGKLGKIAIVGDKATIEALTKGGAQVVKKGDKLFLEVAEKEGKKVVKEIIIKSDKAGAVGLKVLKCFAAGTPILTPSGAKPIEEIRAGDLVMSRSELDPEGGVEPRLVEEAFVHESSLLYVNVAGREIGTTPEHPFYVYGRGWVPAGDLVVGDLLLSDDGKRVAVAEVRRSDEAVQVHNFRVAEYHTYFVGCPSWCFSVWVHNAYIVQIAKDIFYVFDEGNVLFRGSERELEAWIKGHKDVAITGRRVFGQNGIKTPSKTVINKGGVRIDIENPGGRPGQIHVQVGDGKWYYDPHTRSFPGIPKSLKKILDNPEFRRAIQKALEMLGEG